MYPSPERKSHKISESFSQWNLIFTKNSKNLLYKFLGEPMNLVSPTMHLEDWESALHFVITKIKNVDSYNIAIWGSSFSGGHVVVTAAKSQYKTRIKAVLSQVPYLRATSSLLARASNYTTLKTMVQLIFFACVDIAREWMGLSRYYVPVYGNVENTAILSSPSSVGYSSIIPQNPRGGWLNKCPASIAITTLFYNPFSFASDVKAPIFMIGDLKDDLCPIDDVKELAKNLNHLTLKETNLGHFSPYLDNFDEIGKAQLKFLKKNVPVHEQEN